MPTAAPFELTLSQPPQPPARPRASAPGLPAELVFAHQRSWRTSQLLWGLRVTAIFTPPMLVGYLSGGFATAFFLVVGLLLALLAYGFFYTIDVTGAWRIQVTQEVITWETPHNLHGNQGFRVKVSEITILVSERLGENHGDSIRRYHLVMVNRD